MKRAGAEKGVEDIHDAEGLDLFILCFWLGSQVSGMFFEGIDLLFLDFQSCLPQLNVA